MGKEFRWNSWNLEHATKHGVRILEIESVIRHNVPRHVGQQKLKVVGRGIGGGWIQVIYLLDEDDTIYVIHARPLTAREKKRERR